MVSRETTDVSNSLDHSGVVVPLTKFDKVSDIAPKVFDDLGELDQKI